MNILISGSSSGIGMGLAEYFASKKHSICITYLKSEKNAQDIYARLKEINPEGNHLLVQLDVLDAESVSKMISLLGDKWTKVDLFISNAGVDYDINFEEMDINDWHSIFDTKIKGAFLTTKSLLPLMKQSDNGSIVYISASVGWKPDWHDPAYSSASAAVNNFGQSMAIALAKHKIRSNVVCPGPTMTNLKYWKQTESTNPQIWDNIKESNPLKRLCTPNDIGSLIEYIALEGLYINGNIIYVNGGSHLR